MSAIGRSRKINVRLFKWSTTWNWTYAPMENSTLSFTLVFLNLPNISLGPPYKNPGSAPVIRCLFFMCASSSKVVNHCPHLDIAGTMMAHDKFRVITSLKVTRHVEELPIWFTIKNGMSSDVLRDWNLRTAFQLLNQSVVQIGGRSQICPWYRLGSTLTKQKNPSVIC